MNLDGRVTYGKASVSWGPCTWGKDRIIANCTVEAIDDLVTALELARDAIRNTRK